MIIIDTNVIFSALRSNQGSSFLLLSQISERNVDFALSAALVFEYEDVLKRKSSSLSFSELQIDELLDSLVSLASLHSSHFLWRPFLKDPKDDMILELAVVSGSNMIITHNVKDFKGSEDFGVSAINPFQYLVKENKI